MMSKEKTVQLKPEKKTSKSVKNNKQLDREEGKICIIHYFRNSKETDVRPLTEQSILKIKEAASVRQSSSDENARLRGITDKLPEELDASVHGYHCWWYQNLTNIARLKRKIAESDSQNPDKDEATTSKLRRRSSGYSTSSSTLFPPHKCLFCEKKEIKVKGEKEQLTKCITKTAEASITLAAEEKNDERLLCRIRDVDLRAKEAYYHNYCRRAYTRDENRHSTSPNFDV